MNFDKKVKQNYFEPDMLFNTNVPNGVWDDTDGSALYPDLTDFEDYQAYQPPCKFIHDLWDTQPRRDS